jgi:hypothetical protein
VPLNGGYVHLQEGGVGTLLPLVSPAGSAWHATTPTAHHTLHSVQRHYT